MRELILILERQHNDRFGKLMDQRLPGWRLSRDLLRNSPLAHKGGLIDLLA